jgi:hypothetical protein
VHHDEGEAFPGNFVVDLKTVGGGIHRFRKSVSKVPNVSIVPNAGVRISTFGTPGTPGTAGNLELMF